MDQRLQHIVEHYDEMCIGTDEHFRFHCKQCGKCCINREDILLNPKDLYNISKELGLAPRDTIAQYCEVYLGQNSRIPIVRLKPRGSIKRCPLLRDRKCSVHNAKPTVCALFPLGRSIKLDAKETDPNAIERARIQYIINSIECGDRSEEHTVREWVESFGICSHKAAYEIIQNIRCAIMRKMSKMSMGTIQEKSSGEIKQLVIDDTERLEGQIAHAIPEMTASILIPIFVFAYLLFVDWRMALASLASAVLGNVIYYSMMIGRSERMKEYMSANGDMNATIVEYVNGMEVIRMFNQTASSMGRFKGAVLKVRDITTAWYKHCYPFMSISQVVMPSTIAFVLPVGVVLLSGGTTTLNEVILCILLSMGLVGSLQAMIEFWHDIAAIYEIQPRIQALLEAKELPEPIEAQHSSGNDVELKDVHFSYGAIEVIHGVSFTAKAGTVTALVGPSGSGKSTLAKLIARFWDVSAGAVTVGGADIHNLPLSELSEKISYVSQDNFLFNMSLRDNIRIGKPDATDAEVERAASLARCDDFIARFPKGYDTNAGDAGARLSGGERQRLAIARAILKDAPIIILDEATAFTDPENEDKLQQSIDHLTKGKTLIVIAHRLSTIMYADKILMLEDGSISAAGTHEQLLSSSQTYLDMWKAHISAMDWSMNKEVEILC